MLYSIDVKYSSVIDLYEINNIITLLILFCLNNIFYLKKIIIYLDKLILEYQIYKTQIIHKIRTIDKSLNYINTELILSYNKISDKSKIDYLSIELQKNNKLYYNSSNNNNLELYDINNIELLLDYNIYDNNLIINNDNNYIRYMNVNIGFDNYYSLHCFKNLSSQLPFNLLIYIQELDQIVIKVGNNKNYRYINSKLCKIYNTDKLTNITKETNIRSILCNNNIKELNKKCYNNNCNFYHDYILGYPDNANYNRQFSSNPIVYLCNNFKDGSKVQENIQTIEWYNAINLYQASLSNLLIGCMHSLKYKS